MTVTLSQETRDMIHDSEERLCFLHDHRPTITVEERTVQYHSYYDEHEVLHYETHLPYAQEAHRAAGRQLQFMDMLLENVAGREEEHTATVHTLLQYRLHGLQQHTGVQRVFVVQYHQYPDGTEEHVYIQEAALQQGIRKAYRTLIELEHEMARKLGYTTVSALMDHEVFREVFKYHTFDVVTSYVQQYVAEFEEHLGPAIDEAVLTTTTQLIHETHPYLNIRVPRFYEKYLMQKTAQMVLQPFLHLTEDEKYLPLKWTVTPQIVVVDCVEELTSKLQASPNEVIQEIRGTDTYQARQRQEVSTRLAFPTSGKEFQDWLQA